MQIKSQKDFFSGLMFMAAGLAFAWGAGKYNIGNGARMGAGYFPMLLGLVLTALGGVVTFKSLVVETVDGDKVGRWAWRPLGCIIAANLAFGVLLGGLPSIGLPSMGLVAAIFALTIIASLASGRFQTRDVLLLAAALALGSYAVFIVLLKLQLPVWPAMLAG
jgi:hypothetical protein